MRLGSSPGDEGKDGRAGSGRLWGATRGWPTLLLPARRPSGKPAGVVQQPQPLLQHGHPLALSREAASTGAFALSVAVWPPYVVSGLRPPVVCVVAATSVELVLLRASERQGEPPARPGQRDVLHGRSVSARASVTATPEGRPLGRRAALARPRLPCSAGFACRRGMVAPARAPFVANEARMLLPSIRTGRTSSLTTSSSLPDSQHPSRRQPDQQRRRPARAPSSKSRPEPKPLSSTSTCPAVPRSSIELP